MSVSSQFPDAKRLSISLQRELDNLESGLFDQKLYEKCSSDARELGNKIQYLMILAQSEGPGRREMWVGRIDGLSGIHMGIEKSLNRMESKYQQRTRSKRLREQLMGSPEDQELRQKRYNAYQTYQQNKESLHNSNREADRILETGRATLENLRNQGNILKSAHRKMLDVANTLGLSGSLIKMIERRENVDRFLVYAGMGVSLTVLFLLYYYFVRGS
ncbi:hypothetical protein AAMO2058_000967500 [Amorphochlora amoebiformis]|mmetsp:Transcript_2787/g.4218  ORF Transcript_2787/g.4218 Transcript_2787/m.4218 type:complete len:217 (-) Transcript_2787:91-741(-)